MAGLTIDNPINLTDALASENVIPGDVLYLLEGTYDSNYVVSFNGSEGLPITIKNYPGHRVTIDGQLYISGDYITVEGIEITNSKWVDRSVMFGSRGIVCYGNYNRVINCIIYDHDQGLVTSDAKTGHLYYGNLFYFNGWDSINGHGIYPQNNIGNVKTIKHNIVFDNFAYGIHIYGAGGGLSDFIVDGNVCFENGAPRNVYGDNILNGGQEGLSNPIIRNNRIYNKNINGESGIQVGYGVGNVVQNAQIYDNFIANQNNAFFAIDCEMNRFNGNTFYGTVSGVDVGDNTQQDNYPVSGLDYFLTPNEYDNNRANLTIYNWELSDTVVVDVSGIYNNDDIINVHNTQDYYTDIQQLTVISGNITISMTNRTVASPVLWSAPESTFPQFGCFVLEKI